MYFIFTIITGFTGLLLATIIRIELAYPGQGILNNNSEKYLTIASLHAIVMVFFVVIPVLFGAFGNFLLPTQLGIRDVAFPRLNSFMFWITPAGFVMLLHILLFDKSYNLTYWLNYSELKTQLRRRHQEASQVDLAYHHSPDWSSLAVRLANPSQPVNCELRPALLAGHAPKAQQLPTANGVVIHAAIADTFLMRYIFSLALPPLLHCIAVIRQLDLGGQAVAGITTLINLVHSCVAATPILLQHILAYIRQFQFSG